MKFLTIFLLTLVASNAILPSVDDTESSKLTTSVDDPENSELSNSIDDTENSELISFVDEAIEKYKEQHDQIKQSKLVARATRVAPKAKITTEAEARNFIKYAAASYCAEGRVKNWSCKNCNGYAAGGKEVKYYHHPGTDTAFYLAVDTTKELIVLSYRGTQSSVNWRYNLMTDLIPAYLPPPYSGAEIHEGFNIMSDALLPNSTNFLKNALKNHPKYRVIFTGHSLGGALATLTAGKLVHDRIVPSEKVSIITYGQPRVGNPQFAAFLDSKPWTSTRVTSYGDITSISPGRTSGYKHNQHNMHINEDGRTVTCSIYEEDENCNLVLLLPSREAHFNYWDRRMNTNC